MEINARHLYKIDTGKGYILKGISKTFPLQYIPVEGESVCIRSSSRN